MQRCWAVSEAARSIKVPQPRDKWIYFFIESCLPAWKIYGLEPENRKQSIPQISVCSNEDLRADHQGHSPRAGQGKSAKWRHDSEIFYCPHRSSYSMEFNIRTSVTNYNCYLCICRFPCLPGVLRLSPVLSFLAPL